jgi:succinylglutamate desuccinylase
MNLALQEITALPESLLSAKPEQLHQILGAPTLLHLSGKKTAPLFISVLLHGNEPTGFLALQRLLQHYQSKPLPRAVSIFFGNTEAAAQGLRHLDSQPDYNRVWPGSELPECDETRLMQIIYDKMAARKPFASIDIHNNTGLNPHYACINKLDNAFLDLAGLFGRLVVYFTRPKGVQSLSFAELCPAVTLECGRPDQQYGVDHAFDYLNSCLHVSKLSQLPLSHPDITVYHTVAQVKIRKNIRFGFDQDHNDLVLDKDLERLNFTEINPGTRFGWVNNLETLPVIAYDENGTDVTTRFFKLEQNDLVIRCPTLPSMLTLDERVIRQDCLCYLMEPIAV